MSRFRGFTIVECVVALAITALTLLLASWSLTALSDVSHHSLDSSVDWYVFLKEMEAESHHFTLVAVSTDNVRVHSRRSDLDYVLRRHHDTLYLASWSRGGYLPLFNGVKACTFERLPGQRVLVEVTRENDERLVGIIQFYHEQAPRVCPADGDDCSDGHLSSSGLAIPLLHRTVDD